MAKMKIHELAKEITELNGDELKSKDIIGFLNEKGKDYKSPMSNVEDEECELVRKHFTKKKEAKEAPAPKAEPVKTPAPKAAAPAEQDRQRRPVDAQGRPVPPMGPDGKPMRRPVDAQGRPIPLGPDGKPMRRPVPLGPDGKPMRRPVDAQGRPIPLGPDGKPMRRPVPLGPDGKPMRRPVDAQGRPIPLGPDGRPMRRPVDAQGRPIPLGPDGRPVRRPADGQVRPDAAPKAENTDAQNKPAEAPAAEVKAPETPVAEVKAPEIKSVNVLDADGKPLNVFSNPARPVNVYDNQNRNQNRDGQRNGVSRGGNDYQRRNGDSQGSDRGYRDGQRGGYGRDGQNRGEGGRDFQNRGDRRPFDGNRDGRSGDQRGGFNKDRGGFDNRRPGGQGGSFGDKKPFGQRGGAFGGKDFDKDAPQPNRFQKKSDQRGPKDNLKSELANEIEKNKRGNAFNDKLANKVKDKNRDSRNFEDRDPKNSKKKDPNRKGAFQKPVVAPKKEEDPSEIKTIYIPDPVTIKELADKLKQSTGTIIKKLFLTGKIVTINSELSFEEAEELALEYNCIADHEVKVNVVEELLKEDEEDEALMIKRPPVVCVMGHVDHGKTSLLDRIRETNVTEKEAGGITQHIGAYVVEIDGQKITFLDTPGHEAFTSMRMRGAKSTDIAILVVAADDGVMPQTVEAINHAKAANVQIIVAVNKIDKPGANVERVKQELTEYGLTAEEWGGETVFCPVSAKTGEGIENLLEMILLTADVCELKANPNRKARGIVIEAELDKGKGPVATILVQKGTLNVGDNIAIGSAHGKVRAMMDHNGKSVKKATPSTPVEILGLNGVPNAGEVVMVVKDEKEARNIAEAFIAQSKEKLLAETKARLSLDGLFSQIQAGNIKELNIIIKADVQGSVEAVKQSLEKLSNEEVVVRVIHGGVGAVNESDVNLASASNAIIIGFNVKPDNTAKDTAERENVEIKYYRVIYNAIEDVENAMKGMLKPIFQEKVIGHAEVRQTFKASGLGVIAGSYVLDGKITRGCSARITRAGEQIFEGALASLKRFKDDVKEVDKGFECGLVFEKFNDLQEFDLVEFYVMEEIPR